MAGANSVQVAVPTRDTETAKFFQIAVWIVLTTILVVIVFEPVLVKAITGPETYDYPTHIRWAQFWDENGYLETPLPHFLYQGLLRLSHFFFPAATFNQIALGVGLGCYLGLAMILFSQIYGAMKELSPAVRGAATLVLTMLLMVADPLRLDSSSAVYDHYAGFVPINVYHNPTIVLLKPLALLLFLQVLHIFDGSSVSKSRLFLCAFLSVAATMAKPNYSIALIPALGLYVMIRIILRRPVHFGLLIIGVVVPIMVVIGWQLISVRGTGMGGILFAPFAVMIFMSPDDLIFLKFIGSIAFPLCVLMLYFRPALRDTMLQVAWLVFAAGAFYTYLLAEVLNPFYGNFIWSGEITLLLLFVASLLFVIKHHRSDLVNRRLSPRILLLLGVLILHTFYGLQFYQLWMAN
ncbi:MAG: hypothetical protein R3E39_16245 [Anaerolineae bacterium]